MMSGFTLYSWVGFIITIALFPGGQSKNLTSSGSLQCETSQFQCEDGQGCISRSDLCDGNSDCSDGSDEDAAVCTAEMIRTAPGSPTPVVLHCGPHEFRCTNSLKCIPTGFTCDGDDDCGDLSDEDINLCRFRANAQILTTSPPSTRFPAVLPGSRKDFKCASNQRRIPSDYVCDGDDDCGDLSDEDSSLCSSWGSTGVLTASSQLSRFPETCGPGEFRCASGLRCLPAHFVCDGDDDCGDESDETHPSCTGGEWTWATSPKANREAVPLETTTTTTHLGRIEPPNQSQTTTTTTTDDNAALEWESSFNFADSASDVGRSASGSDCLLIVLLGVGLVALLLSAGGLIYYFFAKGKEYKPVQTILPLHSPNREIGTHGCGSNEYESIF